MNAFSVTALMCAQQFVYYLKILSTKGGSGYPSGYSTGVQNAQVRHPRIAAHFPQQPSERKQGAFPPVVGEVWLRGSGDGHSPHIKLAPRKVRCHSLTNWRRSQDDLHLCVLKTRQADYAMFVMNESIVYAILHFWKATISLTCLNLFSSNIDILISLLPLEFRRYPALCLTAMKAMCRETTPQPHLQQILTSVYTSACRRRSFIC